MKDRYGGNSMPNSGGGGGRKSTKGASNNGASTGLKKKGDLRGDVTAQPTNKNPYPRGLA